MYLSKNEDIISKCDLCMPETYSVYLSPKNDPLHNISIDEQETLVQKIQIAVETVEKRHCEVLAVVLCPFGVRKVLKECIKAKLRSPVPFLCTDEINADAPIDVLATITKKGIDYK